MADDILQRLLATADPAAKAALVAQFVLTHEEPALTELIPVLAFLRWFDEPVMTALLPETERTRSAEIFARLTALPFVERVSYGFALHDLTRQGLLAEATSEQRLAAAQAADTYAQREDSESLLESLYCTVLGEQGEAAQKVLEDSLYVVANQRLWSSLLSLFASLQEAESLAGHQVVERTSVHWFAQGLARQHLGEQRSAIDAYNQAITLNPEYGSAYNNRGNARSALGDQRAAIADYDRAFALNPDDAVYYNNRGSARSALGEQRAAIADYDQAIALNPEYALAFYNRGLTYNALDKQTAAITDYDQAIIRNSAKVAMDQSTHSGGPTRWNQGSQENL